MSNALKFQMCISAIAFAIGAHAQAGGDDAVIGDYNVGAGITFQDNSDNSSDELRATGVGATGSGELVAFGDFGDRHLYVFDGRFLTLAGAASRFGGDDGKTLFFQLRLMGNASFGLQAFKIVPINLSFEDVELRIQGGRVSARALIGSTIYLPLNLVRNAGESNFFIALTAGARVNNEASGAAFGLQPKLRYINDWVSLEARYLQTFASDRVREKRGTIQLGLNHFIMRGDQVGLLVSKGALEDPEANRRRDYFETLLFYGGNL